MAVRIQRAARVRGRRSGPDGPEIAATVPEALPVLESAEAVLARIDAALR
jgi:hypothetical protein